MVSVEVHSPHEETVVPAVGDIVTAKVLSVNQRWVDTANSVDPSCSATLKMIFKV